MDAHLDALYKQAVDAGKVPGLAAIAMDASGKVLYSNAFGNTTAGDTSTPPVTTHTPIWVFSLTKLATSIAFLQLLEQGKVDIHDPVEKYLPHFSDIKVLDGFNADGTPRLRPSEKKAQLLHLATHTVGLSYDNFDAVTAQYRAAIHDPPAVMLTRASLQDYSGPFLFEPTTAYNYGCTTDWLGFVVEKVSGLSLAQYVDQHISQPLGLKNTVASLTPEQENVFFNIHAKLANGDLVPIPMRRNIDCEVPNPGGHFLLTSCEDYAQILLTILNQGTHPISKTSLLRPETVQQYIFTDHIPQTGCSPARIGAFETADQNTGAVAELLPNVTKGWSLALMTNNEDTPNGRKAGSGAWVGLSNSFYWMDPTSGKLGVLMSSYFPFMDRDVVHLFDALERAVYDRPAAKSIGEPGSNFAGGEIHPTPVLPQ